MNDDRRQTGWGPGGGFFGEWEVAGQCEENHLVAVSLNPGLAWATGDSMMMLLFSVVEAKCVWEFV